jgi:hypothetical protein
MAKETVLEHGHGRDCVDVCDRGRGATPIVNANVSCRSIALVSMTSGCWQSTVDLESGIVYVGVRGHDCGSLQKLAARKKKPSPAFSAKDRASKPVYCTPLPAYVLSVAGLSYCCCVCACGSAWQAGSLFGD